MPSTNTAAKSPVTRYIGKCPVCEGDFKLTTDFVQSNGCTPAPVGAQRMVHHGFERPGDGSGIHGDCFAVSAEPYEVSCQATREWLAVVESKLAANQARLAALMAGDVRSLTVVREVAWRETKLVTVVAPDWWQPGCVTPWDSLSLTDGTHAAACAWLDAYRDTTRRIESAIRSFEREVVRLSKLIAGWQPVSIRTVDELEAISVAEKTARRDARAAAKAAKLAKKIAFYQGRIDSAVKKRKPHMIADIAQTAQRSLRNDFDFALADALPALGRDHVFAAFGLDVRADMGYRTANADILGNMSEYARTPIEWPESLKSA